MSLFKWSKGHSVYLPEIDAEHRNLCQMAAELHKIALAGGKSEQLKPILLNLLEAADEHFRHEERLMKVVHYSAFEWHKRQHDTVRKRLRQTIKRVEAGETEACTDFLKFLGTWLVDHMTVTDRMMGAFIRNYLRFNTALAS
uniref:Hemerythrin-like metal-binding protein n=1 Tax=Solibacter usitatus (strain Ellin6076) TaxID=234267 RepID=Q01N69_SOLUE